MACVPGIRPTSDDASGAFRLAAPASGSTSAWDMTLLIASGETDEPGDALGVRDARAGGGCPAAGSGAGGGP